MIDRELQNELSDHSWTSITLSSIFRISKIEHRKYSKESMHS